MRMHFFFLYLFLSSLLFFSLALLPLIIFSVSHPRKRCVIVDEHGGGIG